MNVHSLRRTIRSLSEMLGLGTPDRNQASTLELTVEEHAAFRDDGFFIRPSVFREDELVRLRNAVEDIHRRILSAADDAEVKRIDGRKFQAVLDSAIKWEWHQEQSAIRSMEPVHHLSAEVDRIIDDRRLCVPIAELLGVEGVSLFTDKLNFKRPGGAPFPWHQDAPYWAFQCRHLDRLASVQIYLDDATVENGCLWMVPKSHGRGHITAPADRGALGRLYTDIDALDGLELRPVVAPAGSVIFFHGYIVHGSKSNRTSEDRRALILTYQPAGLPIWNGEHERIPARLRTTGSEPSLS